MPSGKATCARLAVTVFASALASLLLASCAVDASAAGKKYMISANAAEFYKVGPAQSFGPDMSLPKGQRVTMLQKDFGYSQVQLEDGTSGYVPTEDLAPAPPDPAPPKPAAASRSRLASGLPLMGNRCGSSNVKPSPEPLFDVTDVPAILPSDPEKPGSGSKPSFRVHDPQHASGKPAPTPASTSGSHPGFRY